jgi:hypothetical protein
MAMGKRGDLNPRPPVPPNTSPFPIDGVLGRTTRGDYKPTDADIEELHKLAQGGNRAERRAATKQLKKLGIALPAAPASPVVMSAPAVANKAVRAEPPASVKTVARKDAPKEAVPKEAVPKKTAPKKAAPKKAVAKKAAAPKKAAPVKAQPGKTTTKKTAVKKSASRKRH